MKKLLLFSFGLLLAINYGYSQPEEYQWLIRNGHGKNGTIPSTIPPYIQQNNYVTTVTIANQFNLAGVASPILSGTLQSPQNDLFIIFSNGQHYNSRYYPPLGVFFEGASSASVSNHNFNTPQGSAIRYLYLTNRYEGDDPPPSVRALSGTIGSDQPYNLNETVPADVVTSNHDVVLGKDITLIIQNGAALKSIPDGNITLDFAGIRPHGGGAVTPNLDFLDLQPVFETMANRTMAVNPTSPVDPGILDKIILYPGTQPYWYVNLRPNVNLNNFPPNEKGEAAWDAVFTLKKGEVTVSQVAESIVQSHDPNFLKVESICKAPDGSYMVSYRIQFENDGEGDAKTYSAEITFPPQFDLHCLTPRKWHGGGHPYLTGVMGKNGRTRTFPFLKNNFPLKNIFHPIRDERIGFVTFTVRVNPGIDVTDVGVSLELINPTVIFDGTRYPLNVFYDLRKCDQDSTSNPEGSSELKNQSPEVNSEKKAISKNGNGGPGSVLLSEAVGGDFHCYRPITKGPCKGCKGPIWKFLMVGAVVLLGLAVLILRKKAKKPTSPNP